MKSEDGSCYTSQKKFTEMKQVTRNNNHDDVDFTLIFISIFVSFSSSSHRSDVSECIYHISIVSTSKMWIQEANKWHINKLNEYKVKPWELSV